jgi:hypothetical protein
VHLQTTTFSFFYGKKGLRFGACKVNIEILLKSWKIKFKRRFFKVNYDLQLFFLFPLMTKTHLHPCYHGQLIECLKASIRVCGMGKGEVVMVERGEC